MLGKLKNIFSRLAEMPEVEEGDVDEFSTLENPNFLTDPDKILKLLCEIEHASPLCNIKIEGSDQTYGSSILAVKTDKQQVLIDELMPKTGNAFLQQKKTLKFLAIHKGIQISFTLQDVEAGFSRGITFYKAGLPEKIYYPQRRRTPRVEISAISIRFKGIAQKTGIPLVGYLYDISRDGAGIELPVTRARIMRGDVLSSCQIVVEDYVMDFDLNVRFFKSATNGSSRVQVGGMFENLSMKSQSKLSHFISALERVEIRRQKA
jgi:c-di-GMP-binding flagellar brake protein YcgR